MTAEDKSFLQISTSVLLVVVILGAGGLYGCPLYRVYNREQTGRAELAQAQFNRQIIIAQSVAQQEAATHLAQAEIERAKGVAEANRIIGQSLRDNEDYLRYLWIHNLEVAEQKGATIIYVPTEANLPILEANRLAPSGVQP